MTGVADRTEPAAADGSRETRTVNSALWAAWSDATGFISELTDASGLRRRTRDRPLTGPVAWRRRLGGKFGPTLTLPAGTYSDDTQLRLATCRALSSRGFDADAFARVELPVWNAYALGGGRATKAAAQAMSKANAVWYAIDYQGWRESGGNGAVMRVQPHAWAAPRPDMPGPWLADVVVNAACSHAHPRALLASVLHCLTLGRVLISGEVPGPEQWPALLDMAATAPNQFGHRPELVDYWVPRYDAGARKAGEPSFAERWAGMAQEVADQLKALGPLAERLAAASKPAATGERLGRMEAAYEDIVSMLALRDPARRGSATATSLAALATAWAAFEDPAAAALLACRALDTDTDTIATMVGALVGAVSDRPPTETGAAEAAGASDDPGVGSDLTTADIDYQAEQARRLVSVASGGADSSAFVYPDLLTWTPPKSQLDAVGMDGQRRVLAGLAYAEPLDEPVADQRDQQWQWHVLDFRQHVLLKSRRELAQLGPGQLPGVRKHDGGPPQRELANTRPVASTPDPVQAKTSRREEERRRRDALAHLSGQKSGGPSQASFEDLEVELRSPSPSDEASLPRDIEGMLQWVANKDFEDRAVAFFFRRVAERLPLEQYLAAAALFRERWQDR